MKMLKNLFALGLLCACTLAAAQWQWLDKDGRKVFSDRAPPPDVQEKNIIKRPGGRIAPVASPTAGEGADGNAPTGQAGAAAIPSVPASGAKPSGLEKELEAKKKQATDAEAAKKKAEEEKIAKAKIEYSMAFFTAERAMSTEVPNEQKPCLSGGETCISAKSKAKIPFSNNWLISLRKTGM